MEHKGTKARGAARTFLIVLWGLLLAVYIAAKVDFFTHYGAVNYVREHRQFWVTILAVVLLVCAVERLVARTS